MKFPFRQYIQRLLPYAITGGILSVFYMVWLMNESPVHGISLFFIILYLWVFFSVAAYLAWTHFLVPRIASYSLRWKILWTLGSLVAGFWLVDNIPVVLPGAGIIKAAFFLGSGLGLGLLLFTLSVFIVTRSRPANPPVKRHFRWLVFALPMIAAWIVYLLAFWPGMLSADSLDQWKQVLTGNFNDHHPAFHTFTIWLLTRLALTPAIVALAQIVALALVVGVILAYIESLGVASIWAWTACLIFAISPINGTMVITLWKDIPYSTSMLGFTYLIFRLVQSKGRWIASMGDWLIFGITAALASLFRHNGLPVIVATFLLLLVGFLRQWKPLALAFTLSMVLYFVITGPLYQLFRVEKTSVLMDSAASLYTIAADADPGSQVDKVFQALNPLSGDWYCSAILPTIGKARQSDGTGHQESILEKAQNLVEHAPRLLAYDYRCNRSLVWIIWDPNGEVRNPSHAEYWIDANPYGITPESKIPAVQTWVTNFVAITAHDPGINWLLWRPALYLYLFLLAVVVSAMRRKNFWILFIAVPILLQSLSFTLITMPPNFRYHYLAYLLALAFWPVIFMPSELRVSTHTSSDSQ